MIDVAPIRVETFFAVAPTMLPMTPKAAPPMKIQRRPKISETRPTIVMHTAVVRVYDKPTQATLGSY
jgi:hypothetical protein